MAPRNAAPSVLSSVVVAKVVRGAITIRSLRFRGRIGTIVVWRLLNSGQDQST